MRVEGLEFRVWGMGTLVRKKAGVLYMPSACSRVSGFRFQVSGSRFQD